VIELATLPAGGETTVSIAQAVLDRSLFEFHVQSVRALPPSTAWWEVLHRTVTEGALWPFRDRDRERKLQAGDLAFDLAALIEEHLGPVRSAGTIYFEHPDPARVRNVWESHLLLVTDEWATVMLFWVND
jgi:hypothetical protein